VIFDRDKIFLDRSNFVEGDLIKSKSNTLNNFFALMPS